MRVRLRRWRRDKPVSGSANLDAVRDAYRAPAEPDQLRAFDIAVAASKPADPRCTSDTRAGTRCKNDAVADGRCRRHPLETM